MKEKAIATIGYCVPVQRFSFIFLVSIGLVHCSQNSQTFFFNKIFIKNKFYNIIYTIKNHFTIIFLFFQRNKQRTKVHYISPLQISFSFKNSTINVRIYQLLYGSLMNWLTGLEGFLKTGSVWSILYRSWLKLNRSNLPV